MITILEHPLVQHDLRILRDVRSCTSDFRSSLNRIGLHLAIEAYKNLTVEEVEISTPMEKMQCGQVNHKVVIVPVLRAGLGLVSPFQTVFPDAITGYIGLRRSEVTFQPEEYYYSMPVTCADDQVILLEVMLATGGSTAAALSKLQLEGISNLSIVALISAPEGIEKIRTEFPNVRIITAALDRELNEKKYILPGLGDAGDRYSGC